MKRSILTILIIAALTVSSLMNVNADNEVDTDIMHLKSYSAYLTDKNLNYSVTVAVIDTGVSNLDKFNGKLVPGYDYIDGDNDPSNDTSPDGHGTFVAGMIADITENLPVKIMPLRVLDKVSVTVEDLSGAIRYAADNGAKVINLSLGGTATKCDEIDSAIDYAFKKDCVIVVSAGNDHRRIPENYCPAHNESVIVVSSVDNNGCFSSRFSNYGKFVDVCAPGVNVSGENADNKMKTMTGTSMSTAYISAGLAMIRLDHPEYSNIDAEKAVKSVCVDLGETGIDDYYGYGLPDFEKLIVSHISIVNYKESLNVPYLSTVVFSADSDSKKYNVKKWYINGKWYDTGDTCTVTDIRENFYIQVILTAEDGTVIASSSVENIEVNKGFFDIILAFLRSIFGANPVIYQ